MKDDVGNNDTKPRFQELLQCRSPSNSGSTESAEGNCAAEAERWHRGRLEAITSFHAIQKLHIFQHSYIARTEVKKHEVQEVIHGSSKQEIPAQIFQVKEL